MAEASSSTSSAKKRKWTVMVYMAAGQSHEIDTVAVRDLMEMDRGVRGNDNVNVVVQINRHWPPSAQRYHIQDPERGSELIRQLPGPTDMGRTETLTDFLESVAADPRFAAEHYCLVLWGHAYGLGFGRDHQDPLRLEELQKSLVAFRSKRAASGQDTALEILGANACAMSYMEAVYQLRDVAEYMVTSQITVPFAGWPYDAILGRIGRGTTPEDLAPMIVDAYESQFDDLPGGSRLEMAAFDLSHAKPLNEEVDSLAKAIETDVRGAKFDSAKMAFYRDVFMGAAAGDVRPLIDATRLCAGLANADLHSSKNVQQTASKLADMLKPGPNKLIRCQKKHPTLDDLNGIGIFAPFVTDDEVSARIGLNDLDEDQRIVLGRKNEGRRLYESLDLFKVRSGNGTWPMLVFDLLRRTIPADLMTAIDGVSEMRRGDRADVAQIVMSIESSLNQLDRAADSAARRIVALVTGDSPYALPAESPADERNARFEQPWLQLIPAPVQAEQGVARILAQAAGRLSSTPSASVETPSEDAPRVTSSAELVSETVQRLHRVECALGEVERTVQRGFTHARFGLGPMNPRKVGLGAEPPKYGAGAEPPKYGAGAEPPKYGAGAEPPKYGAGGEPPKYGAGAPRADANAAGGDLRTDLALTRVADLFGDVGASFTQLEDALTYVEIVTRAMLAPSATEIPPSTPRGRAQAISRAFDLFQEASEDARRTVREVLSHPVYGLGPAEGDLTFDLRQELARRGGLNKRVLKLL